MIDELTRLAFGSAEEAKLLKAVRRSDFRYISLRYASQSSIEKLLLAANRCCDIPPYAPICRAVMHKAPVTMSFWLHCTDRIDAKTVSEMPLL